MTFWSSNNHLSISNRVTAMVRSNTTWHIASAGGPARASRIRSILRQEARLLFLRSRLQNLVAGEIETNGTSALAAAA